MKHFLKNSFETACGKARHFNIDVVEIASKRGEVDCSLCRSSSFFRAYNETVEKELKANQQ